MTSPWDTAAEWAERHPDLSKALLIVGGIATFGISVWWFLFRKPDSMPLPGSRESLSPEERAQLGEAVKDIQTSEAIRQELADKAAGKPPEVNCYELHFAFNRAQRIGPRAAAAAEETLQKAAAVGCLWAKEVLAAR